jgi:uncharacterized protein YutD
MRNIVISRITDYLTKYVYLQREFDITPDELDTLSNEELLDLYTDILVECDYVI